MFDFYLPKEFIAQYPLKEREKARLMVIQKQTGRLTEKIFSDICEFLDNEDTLVLNNVKVLAARIYGKKDTGSKIELLLLKKENNNTWKSLVRNTSKTSKRFTVGNIEGKILQRNGDGSFTIEFSTDKDEEILKYGNMPLPPYIKRPTEESDKEYYQTIYAEKTGAVAAPTAGLHFTKEIFDVLRKKGVNICFLTLYIGWASFKMLKQSTETVGEEFFEIDENTANIINKTKEKGKRIFAVGTSSVRALESSVKNGMVIPSSKYTELFIKPGFEFKVIDGLITNFHLPASTHLQLVCAFAGSKLIKKAYDMAIENKYRFYSYGDAMLIV